MLLALFSFGSVLFWVLCAALLIWEFICIEYERRLGSWIGLVAFVLAIWLLGNFNLIHFARENWIALLEILGGYIIAGIVWSFAKWEFWLSKRRQVFEDDRNEWLERKNIRDGKMTPELQDEWTRYVLIHYGNVEAYNAKDIDLSNFSPEKVKSYVVPRARENKSKIVFWMSHWPFSLFWTMFRDLLAEVWNFLYHKVAHLMDRRAQANFKGIEADFATTRVSDKKN